VLDFEDQRIDVKYINERGHEHHHEVITKN
jgi:hypothetical protein